MFNKILSISLLYFLIATPLIAEEDQAVPGYEETEECKACFDEYDACMGDANGNEEAEGDCENIADECDKVNEC